MAVIVVVWGVACAPYTKNFPLFPLLPRRSPDCQLASLWISGATRYNETFEFDVSNPASVLGLECWEEDTFSNIYIGAITIPLRELSDGKKVV